MSDTVPPKRQSGPVPLPRQTHGRGEGRPTLPPLTVRYYRRMRPQRVYPVVVRWKAGRDAEAGSHPVEVRLLGGGAQIVPSEFTLDPAKPDKTATFYLTPLALGPLRGVRLEVVNQGRKVQEIPLPCKTVRQRGTLLLFVLAFLVPWVLLTYFNYNAPGVMDFQIFNGVPHVQRSNRLPGEAVQRFLGQNIPPTPEFIRENMYPTHEILTSIPVYIGQFCDLIYTTQVLQHIHLAYYAFWLFLFLALCSFLLNQEQRKSKVAKPVELPAAAATVPARHAATADAEPTE